MLVMPFIADDMDFNDCDGDIMSEQTDRQMDWVEFSNTAARTARPVYRLE